jgi:DNA-binding Lrp family transcriptional regulator
MELDKLDRRFLATLQKDARRPAELMGADVGLSASAVQRRIARMRGEAVITAEVALVDPKQAEWPLTMIVDVEVERARPELLASLKQWIAAEPCINVCRFQPKMALSTLKRGMFVPADVY